VLPLNARILQTKVMELWHMLGANNA